MAPHVLRAVHQHRHRHLAAIFRDRRDAQGDAALLRGCLADLGAEVIRVESPPTEDGEPPGDIARHTGDYKLGTNDSQYFQSFNRSKRAITLDIRKPEGRAALHRLVDGVDAVLNNLRGDLPARLGLDYAALSQRKPAVAANPAPRAQKKKMLDTNTKNIFSYNVRNPGVSGGMCPAQSLRHQQPKR
jgi:hypothetical protein